MSIVGTQSVSMGELMKLGPQTLNAMAQGQINSIAPSYMVIAALKALTDEQKGAAVPQPQGTVKDRVIAQATPPMQAGLGQMMPPQGQPMPPQMAQGTPPTQPMQPPRGFAEGGAIRYGSYKNPDGSINEAGYVLPTETGYEGMGIMDFLKAIGGKASDAIGSLDTWMKDAVRGTGATDATKPLVSSGRSTGRGGPTKEEIEAYSKIKTDPAALASSAAPTIPNTSGSASIKASGIGAVGPGSPLAKYEKLNATPKKLEDIAGMNAPKNEQLDKAIADIALQRDPKLAQLAREREAAGLASFGAGMVSTKNGRGFGAAFAPAAQASIGAMMDKDKEARALEMRYEDIARELGLKKGTEEYQRFVDNLKYKQEERKFDLGNQLANWEANFKTTEAGNKEILEARKLDIAQQANAIQAAIRNDANKERYIGVLQQWLATARKEASDYAETLYGKTDPKTGTYLDPDAPRKKEIAIQRYYKESGAEQMEALFKQIIQQQSGIGIKSLPTPQSTSTGSRGPLVGK